MPKQRFGIPLELTVRGTLAPKYMQTPGITSWGGIECRNELGDAFMMVSVVASAQALQFLRNQPDVQLPPFGIDQADRARELDEATDASDDHTDRPRWQSQSRDR